MPIASSSSFLFLFLIIRIAALESTIARYIQFFFNKMSEVAENMKELSIKEDASKHARAEGGRMTTSAGAEMTARGKLGVNLREENPSFWRGG